MSASNIRAGGAYIELGIKDKITQGLRSASAKLKAFGSSVQALQAGVGLGLVGGGFIAAVNNLAGSFLEISKFAKEAGKSIAGFDSSKSDRLSESFATLKATLGAIKFLIGDALAGPLADLSDLFIQGALAVAQFVDANQLLVQIVAGVGAGMAVAGAAILGVSAIISTIGTAVEIATVAFSAMAAVVGFIATPFGAVLAVLVAIGAAIVAIYANWNKVLRGILSAAAAATRHVAGSLQALEADLGINLGGKALANVAKQIEDQIKLFPDAATAAPGGARRPDFAAITKAPAELGGSHGTFFGSRAAAALGIGSGGGIEKKLDESNDKQERIIRVLEDIRRKPTGAEATFQ